MTAMTTMTTFLVILAMGLCAFLPRYLPIVLFGNRELPPRFKAVLSYVPPSVLAAIVLPGLLMPGPDGKVQLAFTNPYLIAGVLAVILTVASKRMLLSSLVATLAFFLLQRIG